MMRRIAVFITLMVPVVAAQTPDDRIYEAIRQNDLAALRTLVRERGVDGKDAQGQTPLMLAAAFGSDEAVRLLLAAGANARSATDTGLTPLHLAAVSVAKTRMLMDAGADVNAVSSIGRTPLLVASSATGNAEVVKLLISRGADVNVADAVGITPLIAAANVNDTEIATLLLAHGANPDRSSTAEGVSTPLTGASRNGNVELVRLLLSRKVDVNATSSGRGATVKNGVIQFGRITALHMAAVSGTLDVLKALLAAGASVDAQDVRGMTPLMFAIATDRANPKVVRMLLDAGASTTLKSTAGESSVDWARKFNNPAVLAELKLAYVPPTAASPVVNVSARAPSTARQAVERSMPLLRSASEKMMTQGGCVACHAQPLTGVAVHFANSRGWTPLTAEPENALIDTTVAARGSQFVQLREGGGLPDAFLYTTFLQSVTRRPASRATDAMLHTLAAKQRQDGSWRGVGATRAPMQDGDISRTALAIRAFTAYATPSRATEYRRRVERAAAWLKAQELFSTENRVMQLLGLQWADVETQTRQARTRELIALQRPDGGWGQTPHLASDAYATGQVLYALRELGTAASDAALRRGVEFLTRTQHDDGSWRVRNRAMKIQPYFEGGFPHEHDQWISHAGTAWAVIGLARTGSESAALTNARR
jgi:ankyrin repeat protein